MTRISAVNLLALAVILVGRAPAAETPVRILVYHFGYDVRGFASNPFMLGGSAFEGGSSGSTGRTGTIEVDVIQATQDGGLVVDLIENVDRQPRPMQTLRCAVYGANSAHTCDRNLDPTDEEGALLDYVGRFFFDATRLDANQHWQTDPHLTKPFQATRDFTVVKTDGGIVTVSLNGREVGGGYQATSTGTIVYDEAMSIPTLVHVNTDINNSGSQGDSVVDLKLVSDSLARTSSENAH
jgi:hypothetical protein